MEREHERTKGVKNKKEAREKADSQAEQDKKERDGIGATGMNPLGRLKILETKEMMSGQERPASIERGQRDRERLVTRHTCRQRREKSEYGYSNYTQDSRGLYDCKRRETMEAKIEDIDQQDARILESEQRRKSRTAYRTSIWDQITENEEIEQARRAERLQARTSGTIKLSWTEKELKELEDDFKIFFSLQSRQRREQADCLEAALRATTEHTARQEAKQKRTREIEISDRLARE